MKRSPAIKRVLLGLLGLGLLALIAWGFTPRPPLVDAAAVTSGPLQVTIAEEGKTRVRDRYLVSASVPGLAQRIDLEVGDEVARGQVLAIVLPLRSAALDPRSRAEAEARVAVAGSALQQATQQAAAAAADADLAVTELARARSVQEAGTSARELVDRAEARARSTEATRRSAEFAVDVARHQLAAARATLGVEADGGDPDDVPDGGAAGHRPVMEPGDRVEVASPVAGRVLKVLRRSEGVVAAGEPLLEVGDPAALEVEVEVLSSDAVQLAPGTRARIERWGGGAPLEGRVRRVEPAGFTKVSALGVEEQRVLVIVDLVSPRAEWERLGDGYRVEAVFVLWESASTLQVPQSALFRREGAGWSLFALEGDVARRRDVEVGPKNGLQAQVLAGLALGQRVITHPPAELTDGARVRIR